MADSIETSSEPLVVCIECDRNIGTLIRKHVEKNGFLCIHVEDPTEILDYIPDIMPDMILTNMSLPVMHGLDALQRLKADSRTSQIPVMIISPDASSDTIVRGLKMGAEDYMVMPFELSEMMVRMENILRRRKGLPRTI